MLTEASNFLLENVQDPIAAKIKQQMLFITKRYGDVRTQAHAFLQEETVVSSRRAYALNLQNIQVWLQHAEDLLKTPVDCQHAVVKEHVQQLDVSR